MNSDPWILDGKLHPAAEWAGLPEWEEEGLAYRLRLSTPVCVWCVEYHDPDTEEWWHEHEATAHEAAALLEKHLREKLAEQGIGLFEYPGCGWNVYRWVAVDELRGFRRAYLLNFGTWEFVNGTAEDRKRIAVFDSEPAAIQAACKIAKGESDEQDAERAGTGQGP